MLKCSRCGTLSVRWEMDPTGQIMRSACIHCGGFNCEVVQPSVDEDDEEVIVSKQKEDEAA